MVIVPSQYHTLMPTLSWLICKLSILHFYRALHHEHVAVFGFLDCSPLGCMHDNYMTSYAYDYSYKIIDSPDTILHFNASSMTCYWVYGCVYKDCNFFYPTNLPGCPGPNLSDLEVRYKSANCNLLVDRKRFG